jgi:PTH2 family peptidyl-tRNA hydrolase
MNDRQVQQVIVMRRDLKDGMPRGKEIAQGAHAAMAWLTRRMQLLPPPAIGAGTVGIAILSDAERAWLEGSFAKITCQVPSLEDLLAVEKLARKHNVECHVITDAGRTVFREATITCLAVGPDWKDLVDKVTGNLRLY